MCMVKLGKRFDVFNSLFKGKIEFLDNPLEIRRKIRTDIQSATQIMNGNLWLLSFNSLLRLSILPTDGCIGHHI